MPKRSWTSGSTTPPPANGLPKTLPLTRCFDNASWSSPTGRSPASWTPWSETPQSGLALLLLLDQFPRQLWRDSAKAFVGDTQALALSLRALQLGWVKAEPDQARRQFWLMPLMHSEELAVQEASLPLFNQFVDARTADFAQRHRDVIARFGRFPHRNAALGRQSRAAELAFLQMPGSGF